MANVNSFTNHFSKYLGSGLD